MFNLRKYCKNRILIDFLENFRKNESKPILLIIDNYCQKFLDYSISLNELLEHNLIGIELLENKREENKEISALYFINSSIESINMVIEDFKEPKYKSLHLYFLNELPKNLLNLISKEENLCGYLASIKEVNCSILPFNENVYELNTNYNYPMENMDYNKSIYSLCTLFSLFDYSGIEIFYQNTKSILDSLDILKPRIKEFIKNDNNKNIHLLLLKRDFDLFTPLSHDLHYQAIIDDLINTDWNNIKRKVKDKEVKYKCNENDPIMYEFKYSLLREVNEKLDLKLKQYKEKNQNTKNMKLEGNQFNLLLENLLTKKEIEDSLEINIDLANKTTKLFFDKKINEIIDIEQNILSGLKDNGNEEKKKDLINKGIKYLDTLDDEKKLRFAILLDKLFNLSEKDKLKIDKILNNKDRLIFNKFPNCDYLVDFKSIQEYSKNKINTESNEILMRSSCPLEVIIREILNNKFKKLKTFYYPESCKKYSITNNDINKFALNRALKEKGQEKVFFIIHIFGGISHSEIRQIKEIEKEYKNITFILGSEKIINWNKLNKSINKDILNENDLDIKFKE